jgi:hypothetical protein
MTASLDDVLREYSQFRDSNILKIDTDGFDLRVLKGGTAFLEKNRPIVFFEMSPEHYVKVGKDDPFSAVPFLQQQGYRHFVVYDSAGYPMLFASGTDLQCVQDLIFYANARGAYYDIMAFPDNRKNFFDRFVESEKLIFPPHHGRNLNQ